VCSVNYDFFTLSKVSIKNRDFYFPGYFHLVKLARKILICNTKDMYQYQLCVQCDVFVFIAVPNLIKIHLKNRVMETGAFSTLARLLGEDKESVRLVIL